MRKKTVFVLSILLMKLMTTPVLATHLYNVTDLGTIEGDDSSRAWSINDNGQIVGEVYDSNGGSSYAVLFDASGDGNNINLGTLGSNASYAMSINNNGQIAGGMENSSGIYIAIKFDSMNTQSYIELGHGNACSISDNGQIVGFSGDLSDGHAVIFDSNGQGSNTQLETLAGYTNSLAYAINNYGQIVGYSFNNMPDDTRAILFDSTGQGNNIDLGTLGGDNSKAACINDNNQIVGRASTGSDEYWLDHAVLFNTGDSNSNIDLGTLPGLDGSVAAYINNHGQIVGQAWRFSHWDGFTAVLFDPTGGGNNIDLNTLIDPNLGWSLGVAICINDNGWIVGCGDNSDGDSHAFLLTPAVLGDFEPDRDVDIVDFAVFASAWKSRQGDDNWNPFCDISDPNDGIIDELDLSIFINRWMTSP